MHVWKFAKFSCMHFNGSLITTRMSVVQASKLAYIHMCIHTHVHTYTCAYIYMCIHTHVHIHRLTQAMSHPMGAGERVLHTPNNPISLALTLSSLEAAGKSAPLQPTDVDAQRGGERGAFSDTDTDRIRTQEDTRGSCSENAERESSMGREGVAREASGKLPGDRGGGDECVAGEECGGRTGGAISGQPEKDTHAGLSFLGSMLFTR